MDHLEFDSPILAQIDETLARSRQIVQESIQLNRTALDRSGGQVSSSFPTTSYSLPYFTASHTDFYKERIADLTGKIQNEVLLKTDYENALKDIRNRLREIENKDNQILNQFSESSKSQEELQYMKERELRNRINQLSLENERLKYTRKTYHDHERLETVYLQLKTEYTIEIAKLSRRVSELERENNASRSCCRELASSPSLTENSRILDSLMQERKYFKEKADFTRKLEHELASINQQYERQLNIGKDTKNELRILYETQTSLTEHTPLELQLNQNTDKIAELEQRLKRATNVYTKFEVNIESQRRNSIPRKRASSRKPLRTPRARVSTASKFPTTTSIKHSKRECNF